VLLVSFKLLHAKHLHPWPLPRTRTSPPPYIPCGRRSQHALDTISLWSANCDTRVGRPRLWTRRWAQVSVPAWARRLAGTRGKPR
jgi:hypothetical protein